MIFWTLQTTIISIILIFLVHHLITFFKTTLTVPKIKDLVNAPMQKYEKIFNTISSSSHDINSPKKSVSFSLDKTEIDSMKNELKNFLKSNSQQQQQQQQQQPFGIGTTDISSLSLGDSNKFSDYSAY